MSEPSPALPADVAKAPPPAAPSAPASDPAAEGVRLVRLAAGFYAIVVVFAFGYAVFTGGLPRLFGEGLPTPANLVAGVVVALGIVVACLVGERVSPAVRKAGESLAGMLGRYGYSQAVVLALLSGFAEELLFRGALWHMGLLGTSLLFGLVHVLPRRELLLYPAFAVGAGLLFGLLRSGSGSVLVPMLAHALVNGVNFAWLEHRRRRPPKPAPAPPADAPAVPPAPAPPAS